MSSLFILLLLLHLQIRVFFSYDSPVVDSLVYVKYHPRFSPDIVSPPKGLNNFSKTSPIGNVTLPFGFKYTKYDNFTTNRPWLSGTSGLQILRTNVSFSNQMKPPPPVIDLSNIDNKKLRNVIIHIRIEKCAATCAKKLSGCQGGCESAKSSFTLETCRKKCLDQ
ncbi:127_t:CDS:2, partial [Ambispora gerdemannii]